jgi:hypothetical protein
MIRLAVYKQIYKEGFLIFGDHLERLPMWSDYLIIELKASKIEREISSSGSATAASLAVTYEARYSWASESSEPTNPFEQNQVDTGNSQSTWSWRAPLIGPKFGEVVGRSAAILFQGYPWE